MDNIRLLYIDLFCGAGGTSTGVEKANGTFSPLGINPDQGRIITAFIGKLSEEQPLVVAKGIELITK